MRLEDIDAVAMQFEEAWSPARRIDEIVGFVPAGRFAGQDRGGCLIELAMIDLERRWRLFRSTLSEDASVPTLVRDFKSISDSNAYINAIKAAGCTITPDDTLKLKIHEFSVRVRLGDLPTPDSAIPVDVVRSHATFRPHVRVFESAEQRMSGSVGGRVKIGRQNPPEPPPYCLQELEDGSKLVCAVAREPQISRHQATVQFLARRWAILRNSSLNRHFMFQASGRNEPLAPGDQRLVSLPMEIRLNRVRIRFVPPE